MNVSFTRAKSKLIIFGSRKTLKAAPLLEDFFELMEERDWVYALPPGADKAHASLFESKKRSVEGKENSADSPPQKKAKVIGVSREALVKGRPLLKDLMNEAQ